ncbi:chemotaxis protein CheW [Acaryochloris marina]|uniref:CheW-like domain-containing protein n=1 Tax=Acaryochloris marina (strain MBIC 11017) TaxID=329726 RepID=B0C1X8_ACAM1|nr:chemotaxis protein CheW [Acaryochloris marina]ABW26144.1 hypothetical protein AM1_1105 [Acaryochloris marina MBIC11017]BDM80983.1 hypothetical protein AM10699_38500 [Acaryochloris marina MBIC10699]
MSATATTESIVSSSASIKERYILTQVGAWVLIFPARWVAEIFRIQRSQILDLPFYQSPLSGVTHHNSQIIPLASAHQVLQTQENTLRETVTVLQLNRKAERLTNMGIIVDRTLGSASKEQLSPSVLTSQALYPQGTDSQVLFQPDWFPPDLWHPQG